ncbi:hypothetical protein [Oceanivirga salmonicida]|uniref:hypothetical protein n=1 Tax=Oceanivirga salmonicida TaxID=1769291 RepID=UPI00082B9DC4|nr:hypothetical protein [Oceanivirga salmonicida]
MKKIALIFITIILNLITFSNDGNDSNNYYSYRIGGGLTYVTETTISGKNVSTVPNAKIEFDHAWNIVSGKNLGFIITSGGLLELDIKSITSGKFETDFYSLSYVIPQLKVNAGNNISVRQGLKLLIGNVLQIRQKEYIISGESKSKFEFGNALAVGTEYVLGLDYKAFTTNIELGVRGILERNKIGELKLKPIGTVSASIGVKF